MQPMWDDFQKMMAFCYNMGYVDKKFCEAHQYSANSWMSLSHAVSKYIIVLPGQRIGKTIFDHIKDHGPAKPDRTRLVCDNLSFAESVTRAIEKRKSKISLKKDWCRMKISKGHWETADGRSVALEDMEESHILNCIILLNVKKHDIGMALDGLADDFLRKRLLAIIARHDDYIVQFNNELKARSNEAEGKGESLYR